MYDPYADFEKAILPNGLELYVAKWNNRPWEGFIFSINCGLHNDPIGFEGLTHFVEHLVSVNVKESKEEVREFFDSCGGGVNLGTTSDFQTKYKFFVPIDANIIEKALDIFGRMLFQVKLEKQIEREREVIVQEFYDNFPRTIDLDFDMRPRRALYEGYWLERSPGPIGSLEAIFGIKQIDLQKHYDKFYVPENLRIICAGGLTLDEIVDFVSRSPFALCKHGEKVSMPIPVNEFSVPVKNHYVHDLTKYSIPGQVINQSIYWSVTRLPIGANECSISVLQDMLNKVLMNNIRTKRSWTYDIHTTRTNFGYFYQLMFICDSFMLSAVDDFEEVVENSILEISTREDLFDRFRHSQIMRAAMLDVTANSVCESVSDDLLMYNRIISIREDQENCKKLKMEDIHKLLPYLRPEMRWTMIGRP